MPFTCAKDRTETGDIMGCPMCDWKTAILMVAGITILFLAIPYNLLIGFSLMGAAWLWSLWPKKSCAYEPKVEAHTPPVKD